MYRLTDGMLNKNLQSKFHMNHEYLVLDLQDNGIAFLFHSIKSWVYKLGILQIELHYTSGNFSRYMEHILRLASMIDQLGTRIGIYQHLNLQENCI